MCLLRVNQSYSPPSIQTILPTNLVFLVLAICIKRTVIYVLCSICMHSSKLLKIYEQHHQVKEEIIFLCRKLELTGICMVFCYEDHTQIQSKSKTLKHISHLELHRVHDGLIMKFIDTRYKFYQQLHNNMHLRRPRKLT